MDLHTYVQGAIKTESIIEEFRTQGIDAEFAIRFAVTAAQIVDVVKKAAYYNKPYDSDKLNKLILEAKTYLTSMPTLVENRMTFAVDTRLAHCAIGLFTESGEILEALLNPDLDYVNIREELGDSEWYQAIGYDALQINPEDNLQNNHDKLKARFPNKFSSDDAINRNLNLEREILEDFAGKTANL
jgi:NTP pyrophosphatase (non-canonical NTP hydrolase)